MQKPLTIVFQLLAAVSMLLGQAPAQQTPAATPAQPTQPASKQSTTPAKKPAATKAPVTTKSGTALTLKTQKEKASYALGMKIGGDLKRQGVSTAVDPAIAAR